MGAILAALLLGFAVRRLVFAQSLRSADDARSRLTRRYGEGCVAVLRNEGRPEPVACQVGGVRIDSVFRQPDDRGKEETIAVFALSLNPDHAVGVRFVADLFDSQGRPSGSTGPITLFETKPHFGEPTCNGGAAPVATSFPLIAALRPPRPGE